MLVSVGVACDGANRAHALSLARRETQRYLNRGAAEHRGARWPGSGGKWRGRHLIYIGIGVVGIKATYGRVTWAC